jgi:predicted dehydrogenase
LVTQIVPSPFTFRVDGAVRDLLNEGYLGDILAIELRSAGGAFLETESPLHWRQDRSLSGYNILNMGIWYEGMIRWVGPATKVMAMTKVNVPRRLDEDGNWHAVTIPDHVDALCELANGAQAHLRISAVTGLSAGSDVWLYGSEGTIHVDSNFNVFGGKRGDSRLQEIPNPPEQHHRWRVEEEFISAIRGNEHVTRTPFSVGVHYMEFTEAVTRSAQTGRAIALPL